jgi:hypothetical protein
MKKIVDIKIKKVAKEKIRTVIVRTGIHTWKAIALMVLSFLLGVIVNNVLR